MPSINDLSSNDDTRRFSREQVDAILRRAIERQGGASAGSSLSMNDLLETARELGIDPEMVRAAAEDQEATFALEEARQAYLKHRKKKYFEHVRSYVTVNVALFLINMITGAEDPWFLFVLGGWGIGLFFDTVDYIWPKERDIEKGMRKFVQYRERERQKTERVLARASTGRAGGSLTISGNRRGGKIIIEKGDKRIEIG